MGIFKPTMYKKNIFDINYQKLKEMGIKCLVFDLDNTLGLVEHKKCPRNTKKLLKSLQKDFLVLISSNNTRKRINPYLRELGIGGVAFSMKPSTRGLKKIKKNYRLNKKDMVMIGDQIVTDVLSGNRFKIMTILVDPLGKKDLKITGLNRAIEARIIKGMKSVGYLREVNIMNSEKRCSGCGILLQDENILQEGYTTSLENDICQRCFRMKNYGEYQVITKSNDEYLEILKGVGQTKDLVLYITDLLNLEKNIEQIRNIIPNKMILVLNKKDVLPKSVKETKLIEYLESKNIHFEEVIVISANKNYNIDYLLKRIKHHQTSKNVYVVGHTNAGKSSLINKLIRNYSDRVQELTMSPLPSTTLNLVNIEINDYLNLIDTPGLVDTGSILNQVDVKMVKKISPNKEIKPKTYQLRKNQSIIIEDLVRIDYVEGERNSFTLFVSNDLKIKRLLNSTNKDELKDLNRITYNVKYDEDLVINGLGFVKIVNKGTIDVYINKDVETFMRKSLI